MNIIGITNQNSGCGYHRVLLPLGFMDGIKGYVTNFITPEKTDGWDILLFNRLSPYDSNWRDTKDLLKCKVVMDIDDYWVLPPNHLNYNQYKIFGDRIENNLREADMVTVTNHELLEKVLPFNSNAHIFPNALPFGHNQYHEEKRDSELIRIFWCGGVSHEEDIKMLRGPISKLKIHADKIKMVIGGFTDTDEYSRSIWQRMFSAFTAGGQLPYMKLHSTPPTTYMQMYEHADIMVIPLENTEWHSCKSNLKVLEAASKRIPVIVSNVAPYNHDPDMPVLWVNSQKDWFSHLNYLILNADARAEYGNKIYDWANKKYNIKEVNQRRFVAFSDLCKAPALLPVFSTDGGIAELSS